MTDRAAPILQLLSAGKSYGAGAALHPTTLDVPTGRTTVLIGPSGCGKTTALRLMMGLLRPDSGEVRFRDTVLTADNVRALRTQMGYVVQDGGLFPHLTSAENVTLMARHLGWSPPRLAERVGGLAELVRLSPAMLQRYPAELSGGQKQRVALMRALMLDPELLLLDEPLGALDPLVRAELQEDLATVFAKLAKSVVLVTHDLAEAAFLGHVIVLLQEGRIVQRGSIADLVKRPSDPFVTRFVQAQRRFEPGRAPQDEGQSS
ncbi:MAG: ATP-binding cassette domain-containing protein [Myxococcales bacterium]